MARERGLLQEALQQRRLWTPALLPGLVFWYDFSAITTRVQAGQALSSITNVAGAPVVLTQGTNAKRPIISRNQVNGFDFADFDGVDDALGITTFSWPVGALTLAAVYNPATLAGSNVISTSGIGASQTRRYLTGNGCDMGNASLTGANLTANAWNIAVADVAGTGSTTQRHWGNGHAPSSGAVSSGGAPPSLFIGSYNNSQGYFDVSVSDALLAAGRLSEDNRQRLEGFLAHSRGLTRNLPAWHPYRNSPPMIGG